MTTKHPIKDGQLQKLAEGITISGEKTKGAMVQRLSTDRFSIALTEGRNRQIRRMCQKVGSPVKNLKRVRITTVTDNALKMGEVRPLIDIERTQLLKSVGL